QGIFKFVTAFPDPAQKKKGRGPSGKPRRDDLVRTVRKGIDGSMMPAFPTLSDAELDDLVSYVIHLSVRGETEFATLATLSDENSGREPQLKWDFWGTVVQPRNLPLGVYRGGRRGEDLYARIYGGIYPSGMTAFHTALKTGPSYPDRPDKIWNVVHFLQALADP